MDSSGSSVCHSDAPCRSPESSTSDVESEKAAKFDPQILELEEASNMQTTAAAHASPIRIRSICCVGAGYVGKSVPCYDLVSQAAMVLTVRHLLKHSFYNTKLVAKSIG